MHAGYIDLYACTCSIARTCSIACACEPGERGGKNNCSLYSNEFVCKRGVVHCQGNVCISCIIFVTTARDNFLSSLSYALQVHTL